MKNELNNVVFREKGRLPSMETSIRVVSFQITMLKSKSLSFPQYRSSNDKH